MNVEQYQLDERQRQIPTLRPQWRNATELLSVIAYDKTSGLGVYLYMKIARSRRRRLAGKVAICSALALGPIWKREFSATNL